MRKLSFWAHITMASVMDGTPVHICNCLNNGERLPALSLNSSIPLDLHLSWIVVSRTHNILARWMHDGPFAAGGHELLSCASPLDAHGAEWFPCWQISVSFSSTHTIIDSTPGADHHRQKKKSTCHANCRFQWSKSAPKGTGVMQIKPLIAGRSLIGSLVIDASRFRDSDKDVSSSHFEIRLRHLSEIYINSLVGRGWHKNNLELDGGNSRAWLWWEVYSWKSVAWQWNGSESVAISVQRPGPKYNPIAEMSRIDCTSEKPPQVSNRVGLQSILLPLHFLRRVSRGYWDRRHPSEWEAIDTLNTIECPGDLKAFRPASLCIRESANPENARRVNSPSVGHDILKLCEKTEKTDETPGTQN
jgi:hypothetical protein